MLRPMTLFASAVGLRTPMPSSSDFADGAVQRTMLALEVVESM